MHNYAIIQNYAILCDFMKIMQYRIDRVKSSSLADARVDIKLSTIKPIHAKSIVRSYTFFKSEEGKKIIASGWRAAPQKQLRNVERKTMSLFLILSPV